MENKGALNTFTTKFEKVTGSYITQGINTSAIHSKVTTHQGNGPRATVTLTMDNSRGARTPGYLSIPLASIPEFIEDLTELYRRNQHLL